MTDERRAFLSNLIANTIDNAEEVLDPLEGLIEKTTADPGSAFVPEVLDQLKALKKENQPAFE